MFYQLNYTDLLCVDTCGLEPHSQDFQSCAYTMSAKYTLAQAEGFEPSEPFLRLGPLGAGFDAHPYFLCFDTVKLDRADAPYLRTK